MFRRNYLAAQGQQFAQAAGGGYGLLEQPTVDFASLASTAGALLFKFPFFTIPSVTTIDFGSSILSDTEPSSTGTPSFKLGQAYLTLSVSQVSSASSPSYFLKRYRAGASATIATWDGTTVFLDSFVPSLKSGSAISNGTLLQGDVLSLTIVSNAGGGAPVPAGTLTVDIEG